MFGFSPNHQTDDGNHNDEQAHTHNQHDPLGDRGGPNVRHIRDGRNLETSGAIAIVAILAVAVESAITHVHTNLVLSAYIFVEAGIHIR